METLNVTKEVKNKINSARTSKFKTQNDIVDYLYEFYAKNHVLIKIIDMLESGKVLMWKSKHDNETQKSVTWILKYKDDLYEMMLTEENKVGITKIGKALVREYIKENKFFELSPLLNPRDFPGALDFELGTSNDVKSDGIGGFGTLYTLEKEEFIKKYIKSKIYGL